MCQPKTIDHIQINICMQNPNQELPVSSKAPNQDLKDMDVLCTFKIKIVSLNLEHVCTKDQQLYTNHEQMSKPIQEPPVFSKAPNRDLKDMDVLCTFKIKMRAKIRNMGHGTNDIIQIKIKMPDPNQEPSTFSEAIFSTFSKAIFRTISLFLKPLNLMQKVKFPIWLLEVKFRIWLIKVKNQVQMIFKMLNPYRNLQQSQQPKPRLQSYLHL